MWTHACRLGIVRQIGWLQRSCVNFTGSQGLHLKDSSSKCESRDLKSERINQFRAIQLAKSLLEQNMLDELKILLFRDFQRDTGLAKNQDNFLWVFLREYYRSLDKPIDVAQAFDVYMKLTEIDPEDLEHKLVNRRGKPEKRKFHPCVMFNLLNLAYADYTREQNQLAKELEDKPEIFDILKRASDQHVYQKILRTVGEHDALKKQRLHGAILLANDQGLAFFEIYQAIESGADKGRFIEYLLTVAAATKEPRILQPLVDLQSFLIDSPSILAKIYNEVALLYGRERDLEKMEQLWRRLAISAETAEDLHLYRYPIYRIRHFYRMANKKLHTDFEKLLRRLGC